MIPKSTALVLSLSGIVLAGGGLTTAWRQSAAHAQASPPAAQLQAAPPRPKDAPEAQPPPAGSVMIDVKIPPEPPLADRLAAIKAEYQAQRDALRAAQAQAKTRREENELYAQMAPDEVAFCRRMIDLALIKPADPAARDALIWVVSKPGWTDDGDYGDEFARAAALLVRHHGDDPAAVSVGLGLSNTLSAHRDALLMGFRASARGPEASGIARLALAQYLTKKAQFATNVGPNPQRGKMTYVGVVGDDGKPYDKTVDQSDESYAYKISLGLCDAKVIRAEAERMYNEVIADYGDVPFMTTRVRERAALLKEPEPKVNGEPLTAEARRRIEATVDSRQTLGRLAEARLDEMFNITPGKPAPEIDGLTLDGKPLKLSDYRGKVVVLTFWGSWCGPCMREVPHERELAEKHKDRPFALLGVDCNEGPDAGRKAAEANQMTWPSWNDGAEGHGPIVARYHVGSYPTTFVIDARGIIRHKRVLGTGLDKAVEQLLAELEARPAP